LCESACPFGALNPPVPEAVAHGTKAAARRRVVMLAVVLPALALGFGWLGGPVALLAMPLHPDGKLAALVVAAEEGRLATPLPDQVVAYQQHGSDRAAVLGRAAELERKFLLLGRVMGGLFGLVLALKLARSLFPLPDPDYRTDAGRCVSCARCFSACPYELQRRGVPVTLPEKGGGHG
jgi:ferredoxin